MGGRLDDPRPRGSRGGLEGRRGRAHSTRSSLSCRGALAAASFVFLSAARRLFRSTLLSVSRRNLQYAFCAQPERSGFQTQDTVIASPLERSRRGSGGDAYGGSGRGQRVVRLEGGLSLFTLFVTAYCLAHRAAVVGPQVDHLEHLLEEVLPQHLVTIRAALLVPLLRGALDGRLLVVAFGVARLRVSTPEHGIRRW
eukprot:287156-Prorocentrum_minimum.AAC.1